MNFDLGSELNLLTLHDHVGVDPVHDDPMDIDSIHSDGGETEPRYREPSPDTLEDEEDAHHLLLDVFSPTSLGAQYALKQKLLMPPPEPCVSEPCVSEPPDHDYEFDTSMVQVSRSSAFAPTPDRSTFDPTANGSFFQNNAVPHVPSGGATSAPFNYNNLMNRSYQYRRQMFPEQYLLGGILVHEPEVTSVQVHHHHYYQSPVSSLSHVSNLSNSPNADSNSPHVYSSQSNTLSTSRLQENQMLRAVAPSGHGESTSGPTVVSPPVDLSPQKLQRGILPLPWDANSVPAERVPYVLSSYLQFALNLVLSCYALHIIVAIVQTIRQDVAHRLESQANNLLVEIALCERSYDENHCSPETIVPALEKMCAYWEKCMHQDPFRGGNTSLVSAQIIGMVVNLLIEPLSLKVFLVSAGAITVVFFCNFAFGYIRAKTYYGWPSAQPGAGRATNS